MENSLRINKGVRPKRKPNFGKWFFKKQVGVIVCSAEAGFDRSVEYLARQESQQIV